MATDKPKTQKKEKNKQKASLFDKLKEANLKKVKSIHELPAEIQIDIIKSVLNTPCIPLSLDKIRNAYSKNVKIMKDGKEISFNDMSELELKEEQGFTPQFFINLVLNDLKYLTPTISQLNINGIMARSYEAFVLQSENPEFDEFRAKCQIKYEDMLTFSKEREKGTIQSKSPDNHMNTKKTRKKLKKSTEVN